MCVYVIAMAVVLNHPSLLVKVTLFFKPPTLEQVNLPPHVNRCSVIKKGFGVSSHGTQSTTM